MAVFLCATISACEVPINFLAEKLHKNIEVGGFFFKDSVRTYVKCCLYNALTLDIIFLASLYIFGVLSFCNLSLFLKINAFCHIVVYQSITNYWPKRTFVELPKPIYFGPFIFCYEFPEGFRKAVDRNLKKSSSNSQHFPR
jgi:hypothetical protein